jgi:hypothetical protein
MSTLAMYAPSTSASIIQGAVARLEAELERRFGRRAVLEAHDRYNQHAHTAWHTPLTVELRRQFTIERKRAR